jgi:hypothetical protein
MFTLYMLIRYVFWPLRTILRQSTALCTLSVLLLKYIVVVIINFDVIGCLFFLSFVLRLLCAPLGVLLS